VPIAPQKVIQDSFAIPDVPRFAADRALFALAVHDAAAPEDVVVVVVSFAHVAVATQAPVVVRLIIFADVLWQFGVFALVVQVDSDAAAVAVIVIIVVVVVDGGVSSCGIGSVVVAIVAAVVVPDVVVGHGVVGSAKIDAVAVGDAASISIHAVVGVVVVGIAVVVVVVVVGVVVALFFDVVPVLPSSPLLVCRHRGICSSRGFPPGMEYDHRSFLSFCTLAWQRL